MGERNVKLTVVLFGEFFELVLVPKLEQFSTERRETPAGYVQFI